jgi:hypothetical protein
MGEPVNEEDDYEYDDEEELVEGEVDDVCDGLDPKISS